jgi:hypothetical protein
MKVTVDKVTLGTEGVWTVQIDPQRLLRLAKPHHQGGHTSILMISQPYFDEQNHSLQFDLDSAILLNLGNTNKAIFIDSAESEDMQEFEQIQFVQQVDTKKLTAGDRQFFEELKKLPEAQQKLGKQLLTLIRQELPGELKFHQKSGKFVESPDNFWVVRVQPRAKSLRIIVYGNPNKYYGLQNTIVLKPDMAGYSNFVIDKENQLSDAINIIRKAKHLKSKR